MAYILSHENENCDFKKRDCNKSNNITLDNLKNRFTAPQLFILRIFFHQPISSIQVSETM